MCNDTARGAHAKRTIPMVACIGGTSVQCGPIGIAKLAKSIDYVYN
jgi:hypothetical protein